MSPFRSLRFFRLMSVSFHSRLPMFLNFYPSLGFLSFFAASSPPSSSVCRLCVLCVLAAVMVCDSK